MGLFGKKKGGEPKNEDILNEEIETEELTIEEEDADAEDAPAAASDDEEAEDKVELSPEDRFREKSAELCRALRMMFPKQMFLGFYYAELQEDGYIDDYCCYTTNGEQLEKDEIPARTGMVDAEYIAREEKLEQAFFLFRRAAVEFTEKPCNGVTLILMNNGQAKLDIVSKDLIEGEEDERYAEFRDKVEKANPRYQPPKMDENTLAAIREKSQEVYQAMGQSFYNFIPGNEFKVAYFYAEFSERGVFYYYRCILNDDTILEKDEVFEHYGVNIEETTERRNEIIKNALGFRQAFVEENAKPFSGISLSITGDGQFNTSLTYAPTDEEGENARLEDWKSKCTGEGFAPVIRPERQELLNNLAGNPGIDPELQQQVNAIYMELGTEYFSYLPETDFHRAYFLCEFSEDGIFTYQRMILNNGETVEGDDMFAKYDMDETETENNRTKIIELIDNIRGMIENEGETAFNSMTLAISAKGEFRSYMSFDPVDPENRDERLEAWKAQYNGGDSIG